jgi:hypothetical protein
MAGLHQSMTTLSVLILSTVELSRVLRAKGVDSIEHELRTVGDAARFIWANFSTTRKDDLAWRHAAMCLEGAAVAGDAEHALTATIALEVLLNEDGLLIE